MATPIWKTKFDLPSLGAAGLGNSFTPYKPPPIPSGYYDPSLDAQRDAASRGLLQTEQDVGLAGRRGQEDYGYETGQINLGANRQIQDIGTQRGYENVDYGRNVEALTRNYSQLGRRQAEQARQYGVTSGGIALLSAAKRDENQALERRDIDTGHERTLAGLTTAEGRIGEDRTSALGRSESLYNRGVADRGTTLSRARSEDAFYGLDVGSQKLYQAQQAGYTAPTGPANQFTRPDGTVVQTIRRDGQVYVYDQTGKLVEKRKAA